METLFIAKDSSLEREDSTLVVKTPDGKKRFPIHALRHVVVMGEAKLTTRILALLGQNDVRATILDWYGNVAGSFEPLSSPSSGTVRINQARHANDPDLRLDLAKRIVFGAMRNIATNLAYRTYRGKTALQPMLDAVRRLQGACEKATTIEELMGFEGSARAWYYQAWKDIHADLDFLPRTRRPPNNKINCLISWLNGVCYTSARHAIAQTHLDGCVSFLHAPTSARFSLALDIAEIFKPAVVDTIIFELAMKGWIEDGWFIQEDQACRLTPDGRKAVVEHWIAKVETVGPKGSSIKGLMLDEALAVERHVLGISPYKAWARAI